MTMRHPIARLAVVGALGLLGVALTAAPALAAMTNCAGGQDEPGIHFGFGFHFGEPFTEDEEMQFAQMRLEAKGYDVVRTELWGSCIRAFIRNRDGSGTHMEFFDPDTLEPVDDRPGGGLNLYYQP
jgi:hypothetical protein